MSIKHVNAGLPGWRPKAKWKVGSETHAGAGRTAREASWIKRAKLSISESVSPKVVAFEELIKPNQGDLFKWRRAWEALRLSE